MIVLADDTENTVTDESSYTSGDDDPNATIYSADNLTFYGNGTLNIIANYNDGITSKDGLIIAGGNIEVTSIDDGIRGKDYLVIKSGTLTVHSGGDGLKSDNDEDTAKGYIEINDGSILIVSSSDAISAETDVFIDYGVINLTSGGGSSGSTDESAKGIKAGVMIQIVDGSITIDAADDAIHSDEDIQIDGGTYELASGDDGIHSEIDTEITAGDINITKSYEGIESALGSITFSDGNIHIVASDDGINISAGGATTGSSTGHKSTTTSEYALNISGGYIYINCEGDGLDSNDEMNISGGTMLVNGPTQNNNGAIDYDGSCIISDGFLLAIGSSGMAEAPGASSSQYSVLIKFSTTLQAGTFIHIENSDGENLFTYETIKSSQSVVFSSPQLENGESYKVYVDGSSSGSEYDGLYTNGTYTPGTLKTSFTISSIVTTKTL
jgi:hypothetical protein